MLVCTLDYIQQSLLPSHENRDKMRHREIMLIKLKLKQIDWAHTQKELVEMDQEWIRRERTSIEGASIEGAPIGPIYIYIKESHKGNPKGDADRTHRQGARAKRNTQRGKYVRIYTHMYKCIYIFTYAHIYVYMCSIYIHIYSHTYMFVCLSIHTHVHIYIYV